MDSLYEAPRRPPAPPVLNHVKINPSVPDVSLIDTGPPRDFVSKPVCDQELKDSFLCMTKKVRFEPPNRGGEPLQFQALKTNLDLQGDTFRQFYMTSAPDRALDLSLLEPQPGGGVNRVANYEATENRLVNYEAKDVEPEPTIKDLFRIIQQQNEQISMLQRQVKNLKTSLRPLEAPNPCESPSKKGVISIIDVKTANFEVFYHQQPRQEFNRQPSSFLRLDGPVDVDEQCLSGATVTPIDISMGGLPEYEDNEESDEFGPTLYNGILNQINNALKITSECPTKPEGPSIKSVKQATLQHLKTIGVNLSPIQESNEMTSTSVDDDVSFTVKQLLMKYLPDDKLTKALHAEKAKPKPVFKPPSTEFSFGTLQYLKKYNIIKNEPKPPKFLDVTALKLQSKLK